MRKVWLGLALVAAIAVGVFALREDGGTVETTAEAADLPPTGEIVKRVEAIRGLKFKTDPEVEFVTKDQLDGQLKKIDQAAAKDLTGRSKERAEAMSVASTGVMALTGIVPESKLDDLGGSGESGVLGLYVPERKRLFVVKELADKDPKLAEAVVAHELTHALEDQHFPGFSRSSKPFAESAMARHALQEGTATMAELEYRSKHLDDNRPIEQMIEEEIRGRLGDEDAPPGLNVLSQFDYADGATFVRTLQRQGGWKTVDQALRRPPTTSSAILNPEKWPTDRAERPRFTVTGALNQQWQRLARADLGEIDTLAILAAGLPLDQARKGAEGWAAGRFEAWATEDIEDCEGACREALAAALVWKTEDEAQQRELTGALKAALKQSVSATEIDGVLRIGKGHAAQAARGNVTVLAFAPSPEEAKRVAEQAAR
ncbi:MAG TPA: hypothetical protein VN238_07490 [Solirubrobacteraceae bacterium]|nr:hypothetical protein [Solirubrobacteraceae bacterium]